MKIKCCLTGRPSGDVDIKEELISMISKKRYYSGKLAVTYETPSRLGLTFFRLRIKNNSVGKLFLTHELMEHDPRKRIRTVDNELLSVQKILLLHSDVLKSTFVSLESSLETIGDWLTHYRGLSGLTRTSAATLSFLTTSMLEKIENGKVKDNPERIKTLLTLYQSCGVCIRDDHREEYKVTGKISPNHELGVILNRVQIGLNTRGFFGDKLKALMDEFNL